MTEKIHLDTYDNFHAPVHLLRIFKERREYDYTATLVTLREVVKAKSPWTDKLEPLFDAILWDELNTLGYSNEAEITEAEAEADYAQAYRTLALLAAEGEVKAVFLEDV